MRRYLAPHKFRPSWLRGLILPLLSFLLAFGLLVAPAQATGVYDLPQLTAGSQTWILDRADAISLANEGKISRDLKKLAQQTGHEVRLVVIRRLNFGETIDSFADELFEQWYPTPELQTNQTLLALDTLTNATAIRTGAAVKDLLTDEIAQSVVRETVAVPLRNGAKYNQASLDATSRLVAVLSGQEDPGPPEVQEINIESTFTSAEDTDDVSSTIWVVVLLIVATIVPMATYFWYAGLPGGK
jgi:uncharacterized protein